jgi:hypothetical protein
MKIRNFAVVGGFAAAAALAFAPLASADDLSSVLSGEESLLNSIFVGETSLAGDSSDVTAPTSTDPFDIITPADISTVQGSGTTTFDYLVYGVDPNEAGLSSDPGSYDVYNGALTELSDAYNVGYYALLNDGALDTTTADYIGSSTVINDALAGGTATDAFDYFWNYAVGDLSGFFDTNLSFLDIGSAI